MLACVCLVFTLYPGRLQAAKRYVVPCDTALVRSALDTAIAQEGTRETTGHNDGPVQKYWVWLFDYPVSYCYLGRVWSFRQAASALELPRSAIPIPANTGLARAGWNDARRRGTPTAVVPQKYDLIYWGYAANSQGHTGQVVTVYAAGWLGVNEFNTSGPRGDPREGDGVHRKRRNWLHPLGRMLVLGFVGFVPPH